jgi:exopolysaccharide biosynthesis polyprenyl glycosylphosphotransferase
MQLRSYSSAAMTTTLESASDVQLTHAHPAARPAPRARRAGTSAARVWLVGDLAALTTALILSGVAANGDASTPIPWLFAFGILVLGFLYRRGMYRRAPRQLGILDGTRVVVTATALAAAIVTSLRVAVADSSSVAAQSVRMWVFATLLLVVARISLTLVESRARQAGETGHPTLIVGAGDVGRLTATRLSEHPELGLRPVGFLDEEALSGDQALGFPVLGRTSDLDRIIEDHQIEHVVVTFSNSEDEVLLDVMKRCEELGVRTSHVPRMHEKAAEQATVVRLGCLPLVSNHCPDPRGWQFAVKYATDRAGAALALALLAPVMGTLALAVWLTSGRPIFYRQERIGRDGKRFDMLKFRSMRPARAQTNVDVVLADDTAPGGVEGDDRRTRIGTFMRRTSLDELPQLLNVMKGEMSFIGPRPERPEFVEIFEQKIHRYDERHRVKSGITGWAQVCGLRGKTSVADRIEWDNYYIENWSLWFDLKILLMTLAVVARPGAVE